MFQYILPEFRAKHLLRAEMLEQLRDYPKNIVGLALAGFTDGLLSGGDLSWDKGILTVSPGMLYWKGRLYLQEDPCSIPCGSMDHMQYLKVRFADEQREAGLVRGAGEVVLETTETDPGCELELCRFFLQEGARLRVEHENFEDFSTRYDTVNLLYAPYAAQGEGAMPPVVLKQYAKELLALGTEDIYDVSFAMNILALGGKVPTGCVRGYLKARTEMPSMEECPDTEGYYKKLLSVLNRIKRGSMGMRRQTQGRREIKLI